MPTRCATIFVYCSGREWSGFAMSGSKISRLALRTLSASLRIQLFFSTLESRFKNIQICCRIRRMRVDGSRIWEEKVADPTISTEVWTGLKSCSSVCLGLSYLSVRFWKPLSQKMSGLDFPSKKQRKMNCFGILSAQVLLLRVLLELFVFS